MSSSEHDSESLEASSFDEESSLNSLSLNASTPSQKNQNNIPFSNLPNESEGVKQVLELKIHQYLPFMDEKLAFHWNFFQSIPKYITGLPSHSFFMPDFLKFKYPTSDQSIINENNIPPSDLDHFPHILHVSPICNTIFYISHPDSSPKTHFNNIGSTFDTFSNTDQNYSIPKSIFPSPRFIKFKLNSILLEKQFISKIMVCFYILNI